MNFYKQIILTLTLACSLFTPAYAARSITVTIDGEVHSCSKSGGSGSTSCKCELRQGSGYIGNGQYTWIYSLIFDGVEVATGELPTKSNAMNACLETKRNYPECN